MNRNVSAGMAVLGLTVVLTALALSAQANSDDDVKMVRKAVERCTLNQPGTKAFHLKATLSPSFARDKDSGRMGDVEYWWVSPKRWRRERQLL